MTNIYKRRFGTESQLLEIVLNKWFEKKKPGRSVSLKVGLGCFQDLLQQQKEHECKMARLRTNLF